LRTIDKHSSHHTSEGVKASLLEEVTRDGGQPLSKSVREALEPQFQHSFANVRVYDSTEAAQASDSLNAKAFTVGENIFFNQGRYQPESSVGLRLLSHELAHTVQQGPLSTFPNALGIAPNHGALEGAARMASLSVVGGGNVGGLGTSEAAIQCEPEDEVQASMPEPIASDMGPPMSIEATSEPSIPAPVSDETPDERRRRIAAADKPLEKDLYDNIIESLPGGMVVGGMKAGLVGIIRSIAGAPRGPLAKAGVSGLNGDTELDQVNDGQFPVSGAPSYRVQDEQ
jgi:Domain of unknown function (DUF4157)